MVGLRCVESPRRPSRPWFNCGVPRDPKTLLVAATGGHLEQLYRIQQRLAPACGETRWVTHDDPQARSLLAAESVRLVPYVPPRGYRQLARVAPVAWQVLRSGKFDRVISTGAGVAIPFLAAGRLLGIECHYIESAARADGPSFTGRMAARMPGVHLYTQYQRWADKDWVYRGSLFDDFEAVEVERPVIERVVVTLGTMRTYGFRRAVDRLRDILPEVLSPGGHVLWQVGVTDGRGLVGDVRENIPNVELRAAIRDADLVVAHSGIGSAITALELGKRPVLLPRRIEFGEHVDEHQTLIAGELDRRRLAVAAEAGDVTPGDLIRAASGRVLTHQASGPFRLVS